MTQVIGLSLLPLLWVPQGFFLLLAAKIERLTRSRLRRSIFIANNRKKPSGTSSQWYTRPAVSRLSHQLTHILVLSKGLRHCSIKPYTAQKIENTRLFFISILNGYSTPPFRNSSKKARISRRIYCRQQLRR